MQERVCKLIPKAARTPEIRSAQRGSEAPTHDAQPAPTICTFHSLCVRILRQHIEKLGYKRNFVIYDESEQLGAIKKILAQISAKGEKTDPAAILSLLSRFRNGGERAAVFGDPSVARHGRAHPLPLRVRPARLQCGGFRRSDPAHAAALPGASRRRWKPAAPSTAT